MKQINFLKSILYRIGNLTSYKTSKCRSAVFKYTDSRIYSRVNQELHKYAPKSILSPPLQAFVLKRFYSEDTKKPHTKLMNYDMIVWPSLIKTIKNWIYVSMIVRPYFDPEFSLGAFVNGAKQAAEIVSSYLAEGNFEQLEGLLTPQCINEIKANLAHLNATQRHELAIKKDDIYFSFPYELGIIFDEAKSNSDSPQKRHVEVTVVHHVLRGHSDMIARGEPIPLNIGVLPEFRDKIFILNYRFIRNYTKGVTDDWTLNVVNHFKPSDSD